MPNQPQYRVPESFRGLSERESVDTYTRNLPHWRQEGATYFVTFRLKDSLPLKTVREIRYESERWEKRFNDLQESGREMPASLLEDWKKFQKRRFSRVNRELDCGHGECLLRSCSLRSVVDDSLRHFNGDRYDLYAFVTMPNHVHLLLRPLPGHSLEKLLQSIKSFTSKQVTVKRGTQGGVWQRETYDRIVRDEDHFRLVATYIEANPNKARLREGESTVWISHEIQTMDARSITRNSKLQETPAASPPGGAKLELHSTA